MARQQLHIGRPPTLDAYANTVALTAAALLSVFLVSMALPVSINLAGARLTPQRMLLLVMVIPLFFKLISGQAGKIYIVDALVIAYGLWVMLSILANEGASAIGLTGISGVEVIGGYLFGRCLVRNARDYELLWKMHFFVMLFLLPFAVVEHLTGRQLFNEVFSRFGEVVWKGESSQDRWGLARVIAGFDHPILFGMFCAMGAANAFFIWARKPAQMMMRVGLTMAMTFMSLSSGALLLMIFQVFLVGWGWITKAKWTLLFIGFVLALTFISLASNRGPIVILIEEMTFNPGTGWTRIIQFQYSVQTVMQHLWIGQGVNFRWEDAPGWVQGSVDNYWLVVAMRHGIVGLFLILMSFVAVIWVLVRQKNLSETVSRYRTGYIIALVGVALALVSVHIWGGFSVFIFAYLGAAHWMTEQKNAKDETALSVATTERPDRLYSRFKFNQDAQDGAEPPQDSADETPSAGQPRYTRFEPQEATRPRGFTKKMRETPKRDARK